MIKIIKLILTYCYIFHIYYEIDHKELINERKK